MYDDLATPAVVAELDQVEENIRDMVRMNAEQGIRVRPHIKPHKSCYLARLQLSLGCRGITCAKLGEAEVMADCGIRDILIAFPLIGKDKMERLGALMQKADMMTIVNSETGAAQLSDLGLRIGKKVRVLIEIDGGINRGGLKPGEPAVAFARAIGHHQGIEIIGLLYYGGTIYSETTLEGFDRVTRLEHDNVLETAALLRQAGFTMEILSGGSSYSSKRPQFLNGITEVRPGHFIFNDAGQLVSGFATERQCALRVVATVVCVNDEHHAIIDAGSKTLTTDLCGHRAGYGYVAGRGDILIAKLNEEHGFIESEHPLGYKIGDKIAIIPNHACVIPNLADEIYGFRNGKMERMIRIDARGKNR
ncbi:MAG: alanine racemase [Clostridiaceae bacterium]|nr:alanine racemase [Clostridiaceae bacterium]